MLGWMQPLAALVLGVATPLSPSPRPRELVNKAVEVMGGAAALNAVQSRTTTYSLLLYANFTQEDWPGAPKPHITLPQTEFIDWTSDRYRTTRPLSTATTGPLAGRSVSWVLSSRGNAFRNDTIWFPSPPRAVRDATLDLLATAPEYLLQLAMRAADAELTPLGNRTLNGRSVDGVGLTIRGLPHRLWFDVAEGYLDAMDRMSDAGPIAGEVRTEYSAWTRIGNLRVPRVIRMVRNGETNSIRTAGSVKHNEPIPDSLFTTPQLQPATDAIPIRVNELAPGVLRLEGTTHSSIAVQQGSELILLEAPVGAVHTKALFDTLRARFPRTPVRRIVATHHHGDHASGVAEAFGQGATAAFVPADQTSFFENLGKRWDEPTPKRKIIGVKDSTIVGAGANRFELARIPSTHAWGLLVAWFPQHEILFEADLQNSGQTTLTELRDFVAAKGWKVKQVSGVHGKLVSWPEFLAQIK